MRTLWNDIRYGLRMLGANPAFTAVAILSLAIGIGATTSMFGLADALLLRPLPVAHSEQMVHLLGVTPQDQSDQISYPDYLDFRDQNQTLAGLICSRDIPAAFDPQAGAPAKLRLALAVSPNYFDVLGVHFALGRGFRADEEKSPSLVLSDWFWEYQFGRDPSVIGRKVRLSRVNFTIVGVAPKSFPGLDRFIHESAYVPVGVLSQLTPDGSDPFSQRDRRNLTVYGRLRAGRTAQEAQSELQSIAKNLERAYPDSNRARSVAALPEVTARIRMAPGDATQAGLLLALATLVLLIACANVISLLLARARARSREVAIRLAIGASRARLFRQLLTESLLLGLAGGAAGMCVALGSIQYFSTIRLPTDFPLWLVARPDMRVLLVCGVTSLLSGVLFGVAPALHTLRTDLTNALKTGDAAPRGRRFRFQTRSVLVAGQVGVSLALLLVAGLLYKDFSNLLRFRPGFRTDHMLVMLLDPETIRYKEPQARAFYRQLVTQLEELPGVKAVALGQHVPLGFSSSQSTIQVEGFQLPQGTKDISVDSNVVDDRYFPVMKLAMTEGRTFSREDTATSPPVAIVNEAMAHKYWPQRSAIGGRIHIGSQTLQVVGIAKDIKYRELTESPLPFLYLPLSQQYRSQMTVHVEAAGDPAAMAAPVLAEIRRIDPAQPVQEVQTLDHFFEEGALFGNRLIMRLVTAIGVLGLLLATTGLYGSIAYSASRRTREIGIRMAVGAHPGSVARLILKQGLTLTLAGVGIGVVLALLASQVIQTQLVGISARDPWVYGGVSALLALVSLLACYLPARRAARIDPVQALRQE